jgi:hypothetical protein
MPKRLASLAVAMLATLAACGESPTSVSDAVPNSGEMVITQGAAAPTQAPRVVRPSLSAAAAAASLGGSVSTALSLTPQSCAATASQQVVVTYTITGNQLGTATFSLNTHWTYSGSSWSGSTPTTLSVAPRVPSDPATIKQVTITVTNASGTGSGASNFNIVPFGLTNSNATGAKLSFDSGSNVTMYVSFAACAITNTAPTLVLPNDMTVEAATSAGTAVNFVVTATDNEEGDLTGSVTCSPASGSTFPLGETVVNCSVTDGGGLTTQGSFKITVVDTTPASFTSFPSGTITLIAADINGAVLDVDGLGITVEDFGHVSEPSTFSCDYVAGTVLGIGSTTTVSCTAKDAIGNESEPSSFDVFVGLNVSASGFLPPLRMVAPFSVHKRGSTVPHKFLPPAYADGTPAVDLAGDLRLVLNHMDGSVEGGDFETNDYSAGSTAWRYDPDAGQYVFNLKTGTASPWDPGTWKTTVSYKGITLATTYFDLKK